MQNPSQVSETQNPLDHDRIRSKMPDAPLITIFTPTYNRAHTLHRVYDSLSAQTLRDFEWLLIDDGSTDDTGNLVAGWMRAANFPIRYLRQENAGKHFAHNWALIEARGRFFIPLDSDDALVPEALEWMTRHWNTIPESQRHAFYAVDGLCCDQKGKIVDDAFPTSPFDSNQREYHYVHRVRGEKLRLALTEILRRYPFPEIARGQYLPEGIVWLDIAKTYKIRCVNDVVRIYYIDDAEPGVTANRKRDLSAHAIGRWYYYIWMLNNDFEYFPKSPARFMKTAVMLLIVGWFSGRTLRQTLAALTRRPAKLLVLLALPFSALLYALGARASLRSAQGH